MFEVDFYKVGNLIMHPLLRTLFNLRFLNVLLDDLVSVYNTFKTMRTKQLYILSHNGQVCYMQGALNDAFDIAERRIYIRDAGGVQIGLIHTDEDQEPEVLQDDTGGAMIIHNDSAYDGGAYDFIVVLPFELTQSKMYELRALVDLYKLTGKRYDVITE